MLNSKMIRQWAGGGRPTKSLESGPGAAPNKYLFSRLWWTGATPKELQKPPWWPPYIQRTHSVSALVSSLIIDELKKVL